MHFADDSRPGDVNGNGDGESDFFPAKECIDRRVSI